MSSESSKPGGNDFATELRGDVEIRSRRKGLERQIVSLLGDVLCHCDGTLRAINACLANAKILTGEFSKPDRGALYPPPDLRREGHSEKAAQQIVFDVEVIKSRMCAGKGLLKFQDSFVGGGLKTIPSFPDGDGKEGESLLS